MSNEIHTQQAYERFLRNQRNEYLKSHLKRLIWLLKGFIEQNYLHYRKMKFSIEDFFSKSGQIARNLDLVTFTK